MINVLKNKNISLLKNWTSIFIDPRKILALRHLPSFFVEWRKYQSISEVKHLRFVDSYPCLADKTSFTPFDPHYFFQSAWLARRLDHDKPKQHVDIGSSIGMVSILSAFVPTVFVDYRPLKISLKGLQSIAGDLLRLPFKDNQLHSLSSLHVLEHIGLGRYGDPLNPDGSRLAAKELSRVLAPGGKLFLSVPVGRERTQFNAQRVFHPASVLAMFDNLRIDQFSLIDDDGRFMQGADIAQGASREYG